MKVKVIKTAIRNIRANWVNLKIYGLDSFWLRLY